MPRSKQKDAATELAEKMVQTLENHRHGPSASYPLELGQLATLADAQAAVLLARAVKKPAFKERVAVAKLDRSTSLVALVEDRALLAADLRVLESALAAVMPKNPKAQPLPRIASKVAPELREVFIASVQQRIADGSLPPRIGTLDVKGTPCFYLRDRPPEEIAAAELAEQMVHILQEQRSRGPEHYPIPLQRLLAQAAPGASPRLLKKVLAHEAFQRRTIRAAPKQADTPVALAEDPDRLAASIQVLEFLLEAAARPAVKAFPLKDLKKALAEPLRQPFVDAASWNLEQGKLPAHIGWLWIKTPHLFFSKDAHGLAGADRNPPDVNGVPDFGAAFTTAFDELDRQGGGRNFVSLVELRKSLPVPRSAFDAELFKLRRAGRYRLSAAEGRHGITPEEHEAGIPEEGSLLLFVSRSSS